MSAPAPALALTGRVVDAANILSAQEEDVLSDRLAALEARTGHQMVVATTPDLQGQAIAHYSLALARAWRIGRAHHDDGVLILVAPHEKSARIEVGYGLEDQLTDPLCAEIMDDVMVPRFRKSDYAAGLSAGVDALIALLP
ncbi:TPM domain-containing protein [Novosphingobium mangrovi (ex Hu et al. 2023)]|uniref:TPM domain-containing protein n=1 Tax=Novosphingobium mangrovi (ex Hu et al. 2023) TaxID=2930094 RepID=A0ABT0ABQ6_9SPHN|nr:TPM domain-containing protein [Novosphingobium mangrovi (ex Hu et al. 2023)]MCJ1960630.1 TPM domain-containing protein [Novosphingobium mangrovi (ex Hu et al. 2023)]